MSELPAYENGYPVTYYVVEESVNVKPEYKDIIVTYSHSGNDWVVTNTPAYKSASFKKQWIKADGASATWPKDTSDKDLPVTVRVTRRLAYEENGETKYSADQSTSAFSLIYSVTPGTDGCTLTHVNGKTATDEDKATYGMEVSKSGDDYICTIANLDNVGTLAVGAVNKTGKWDYRFEEISGIEGYEAPAYYDSANTNQVTGVGAKAQNGGVIRNVQEPVKAQFAVTKQLKYGDGRWPEDGFEFTLAYDEDATAEANQGTVEAPNLSAEPEVTIDKSTPSSRKAFDEVTFKQKGTYKFTITETIPDDAKNSDGVKWSQATDEQKDASEWFMLDDIRYYHKPSTVTAVVKEENGALKLDSVTYKTNDSSLTVENTYAGKVGFDFAKVWLKPDTALPTSEFVAWPEGQTIDLALTRYSNGAEDAGFAVEYKNVGATTDSVAPTSVKINNATVTLDTDSEIKQAYTLTRTSTSANLYEFTLPEGTLDGLDASGNQYVYRMVEAHDSSAHEEYALKDASGLVYATSKKYSGDDGVIVNRDNTTSIQVTKVWQNVQGVQEGRWPTGRSLALTLHWSAEGGASGTHQLNNVGDNMSGDSKQASESITIGGTSYTATVTVTNANPALITIDGLPYQDSSKRKYTYTIEETRLAGYMNPTYNNLASQSTSSTVAYDGATITNRERPAEQTMPFEVTKRLVLSADPSQEAAETLWPNEGFSFTLNYVGYKEVDSDTGDYSQDFSVDGYYDNTGYPLLSMPDHETITITKDTDSNKQVEGNDHKAAFGAVKFYKAGTYYFTITEGATTDYYRNDEGGARKVKVTVAKDNDGVLTAAAPVYYADAIAEPLSSPIFTNQFKANADVTFSKIWLSNASAVTQEECERWPADKQMTVKLVRYDGNSSTRDESFEITYVIGEHSGENNATITPTAVKRDGIELSGEALAQAQATYALTKADASNVYSYTSGEAFERKSTTTGLDYQYFFTEDKVEGYADPLYGSITGGAFNKQTDAAGKVKSGDVIANAKDTTGGAELPFTGGMGTTAHRVMGMLVLVCAAMLWLASSRTSRNAR